MNDNESFCEWKSDMSVGSEELDYQHRHMIEIINEVYRAFIKGEHREVIGPILDKLSQYVVYHFTMEEVYFEMFNFYDKEKHIKEHNMFREKVIAFNNKFKSNDATLTCDVMNFLKDWLHDHVLESDQKYIDCFAKNGVK
ncbi:MAG TPA: bacteriohemerythrin [Bacteroidales bacterium]|nr:bacteriohemerythrin [Bacteroidales bacterium]